jgi:hypothetical protein
VNKKRQRTVLLLIFAASLAAALYLRPAIENFVVEPLLVVLDVITRLPQFIIWAALALISTVVLGIGMQQLWAKTQLEQEAGQEKAILECSRIQAWHTSLKRARRGLLINDTMVRIRLLTAAVLAHNQGIDPEQMLREINRGTQPLPQPVNDLFEILQSKAGMSTAPLGTRVRAAIMGRLPGSLRRRLGKALGAQAGETAWEAGSQLPFEPDLERTIQYLEQELEKRYEHNNR